MSDKNQETFTIDHSSAAQKAKPGLAMELSPRTNSVATVGLFFLCGVFAAYASVFGIEWIFYTTKPFHFLHERVLWGFILGGGISFSVIPLASVLFHQAIEPRPIGVLALVWLGTAFTASLIVRYATAIVHRSTLSLPEWLLPVGLLFIPASAALTVLLAGLWNMKKSTPRLKALPH